MKTMFHQAVALVLVSALTFGQIVAGFLHDKHDAHEAVIVDVDKSQPVLLNHGEHCKVCALDWVPQSDIVHFEIDLLKAEYNFLLPSDVSSPTDVSIIQENNKAPPFLS